MSGECAALADALRRAGRDWIVPDWPAPPRVAAFATTRNGGVSTGRYASLNLGAARPSGDRPDAVSENRARVRSHLPAEPRWLAQVHGATVHAIAADAAPRSDVQAPAAPSNAAPVADAAVTRAAGVVLTVLTADCLPVLLADRDGSAIGIAHAGWRGLAAGVIERAIQAMDVPAAQLVAWLGPAIGPAAFEVGADVRDAFLAIDASDDVAFRPDRPGKWRADLFALARRRLERAGVCSVYGGGVCTASDPARFFSYRRDGETGRAGAFLWLRPA